MRCFKVAIVIVNPKKEAEIRVKRPNIIKIENTDSDKDAINPKNS